MTSREIQLVCETLPLLRELSGPLGQLFYGRLFQRDPELRALFRGDVRVQGKKFTDMLTALAEGMGDLDQHRASLVAMGLRHVGYGVKPEHYERTAEALLWAMAQCLESEFTPEVRSAWRALISEVAVMMLPEVY